MTIKINKILAIFIMSIAMISCGGSDDGPSGPIVGGPTGGIGGTGGTGGGNTPEYLKDFANFPIGNIVSTAKLSSSSSDDTNFKEILNNEFNSITAENEMKSYNMFIGPGNYDWSDGDAIVAYAKVNGMRVHGHALAWHSQQPGWFNSFSGTDAEFETAVMDYITATVAHFAEEKDGSGNSVVASWDVFNEAYTSAAPSNVLFTKIDDVIAKCFTAARAGDANVKLFYNDYNIAGTVSKRNDIITMVNDLLSRNIPIDGVGMQMHLNHDWPSNDLPTAIQDIANTGLLVHLSELDIKANYNNDVSELTAARAQAQADQFQNAAYYYKTLVPTSQQHGITIWGFRDRDSWLYDNGGDWPLLFDNSFDPKPAYDGFVDGLKGNAVN